MGGIGGGGRTYTAGKFMLELDGTPCGFLQSFEGGTMVAEMATHKDGANHYEKKHITSTKWSPVKFRVGAGMGRGVFEWMRQSFSLGYMPKNGAITVCDFNYKAQRRIDLFGMLITKVTFPALDGASKDSMYFDIEVTPESCRWVKEGGQDVKGNAGVKQKAWQAKNFKFELAGLPTGKVSKVEGLSFECKTKMDEIGGVREHSVHPVATTVSDITVYASMSDVDPWAAKAEDWFIRGNCLEQHEMTGAVTLLGPDGKENGRIELMNVGFKEFEAQPKLEAQSESVARFKVKLYVEQVNLVMTNVDA
jgi:hypothetical protein